MATIMTQNNFPSGSSTKKINKIIDNTKGFLSGDSMSTDLVLPTYKLMRGTEVTTSTNNAIIQDMIAHATTTTRYFAFFPCKSDGTEASYASDFVSKSKSFTEPKKHSVSIKSISGISDPYNTDMLIMIKPQNGSPGLYIYDGYSHQMDSIMNHCFASPLIVSDTAAGANTSRTSIGGYGEEVFYPDDISDSYNGNTYGGWLYDTSSFNSLIACHRSNAADMTDNHILIPAAVSKLFFSRYFVSSRYTVETALLLNLNRTIQIPIQSPITTDGYLQLGDFFVGSVEDSCDVGSLGNLGYLPTKNGTYDTKEIWSGESLESNLESPMISIRVLPIDAKAIVAGASMYSRSTPNIKEKTPYYMASLFDIENMDLSEQHNNVYSFMDTLYSSEILKIHDALFEKDHITFDDVLESCQKFYIGDIHLPAELVFCSNKSNGDVYVVVANSDGDRYRLVKYDGQIFNGYTFAPKFKR